MDFSGKHVLVTGGALRVGAALCRAFAAAGAQVTIHCRGSAAEAERLAAALPGCGHAVAVADFTPGGSGAAELWSKLSAPVDILVNNASCYRLPPERSGEYEKVNRLAPLELMRRFAEQDLREGAVVNFLDQAVLNPNPAEDPDYVASRRGLMADTLEFARRYGAKNLRFNAVAPGPVIPPRGLENSKMLKTLRMVPLGRPVALDDLVEAVLFLAGCDSVTGAILPVDCGMHLGQ